MKNSSLVAESLHTGRTLEYGFLSRSFVLLQDQEPGRLAPDGSCPRRHGVGTFPCTCGKECIALLSGVVLISHVFNYGTGKCPQEFPIVESGFFSSSGKVVRGLESFDLPK